MTWRTYLVEGWRRLPGDLRRVILVAGVVGVVLTVLAFVLPPGQQVWAVLALVGMFVLVQAAVLWHFWRLRPTLRRARRLFMDGQFEEVVTLLEAERAAGQGDAAGFALLGNAYRQLGQLERSEAVLREAYTTEPEAPHVAYGLGRTLLALGHYDEAADLIALALEHGGQPVIEADLGHALYRAGQLEAAARLLIHAGKLALEPHRALMTRYLLWRIRGAGEDALRAELAPLVEGLALWRAEASRCAMTPYGAALAEDVEQMERLLAVES